MKFVLDHFIWSIVIPLFQSCLSICPLIPHFTPIHFTLHIRLDGSLTFDSFNKVYSFMSFHPFHYPFKCLDGLLIHLVHWIYNQSSFISLLLPFISSPCNLSHLSLQMHIIQFHFKFKTIQFKSYSFNSIHTSYTIQIPSKHHFLKPNVY